MKNDSLLIYFVWYFYFFTKKLPKYSSPCSWNFGQFEEKILDTALYLIMKDRRIRARNGLLKTCDPVWLSRIISACANSSEDDGILTGNWSGDYEGGVSPVTWNGSVKIIQQYAETKTPVKFGQCWVFSGRVSAVWQINNKHFLMKWNQVQNVKFDKLPFFEIFPFNTDSNRSKFKQIKFEHNHFIFNIFFMLILNIYECLLTKFNFF